MLTIIHIPKECIRISATAICVIITLVTIPVIDIVGVAVIASLKAAVMVTVSEEAKKLSLSVSEKLTVGPVVS